MQFYDPNGKTKTLERWRTDNRIRAMGAIMVSGGVIRGKQLAAILGVSPRALRLILLRDNVFQVEYRYSQTKAGRLEEAWYRLNPDRLPKEPVDLPALRPRLCAPKRSTEHQSQTA